MLQQLQEAACNTADVEKKETCLGLNLVVQFLFQELKDTQKVRRYLCHCCILLKICDLYFVCLMLFMFTFAFTIR